jgi:hypothetical protein
MNNLHGYMSQQRHFSAGKHEKLRTVFTILPDKLVCTAGGILIGCRYNGVVFWLLQRKIRKNIGNYHIYEDFGGGIESYDLHISDTIYREAYEETSNILTPEILDEIYKIGNKNTLTPGCMYVAASKYLLSVVVFDYNDASDNLRALFDIRYGDLKKVENGATLHWLCQIPLNLLNPRIKCYGNDSWELRSKL